MAKQQFTDGGEFTGNVTSTGSMSPGNGSSIGGAIWSGSGAPSNSLGADGDLYQRTDSPGLYQKSSGTWSTFASGSGDAITSPNSTITVGGTSTATTLDINLANANTWTGEQQTSFTPTNPNDLVTKAYADGIAAGLAPKLACQWANAATLPAYTYSNGASGVGATITATGNGAFTPDGTIASVNDRVLIYLETSTNAPYNGIYTVTTVGDGSTQFVLTRATDNDETGEFGGAFTFILGGTANTGKGFVCITTSPTVGTTAINWTQFSSVGGTVVTSFNTRQGAVTLKSSDIESTFSQPGQLYVGTGNGTGKLISKGATGTFLGVGGSDPSGLEWTNPTGGGAGGILAVTNYGPSVLTTVNFPVAAAPLDTVNLTISFTAPSTGNVLLHMCMFISVAPTNTGYVGWSHSTSPNTNLVAFLDVPSNTSVTRNFSWYLSGLTAGVAYTLYLLGASSASTGASYSVAGPGVSNGVGPALLTVEGAP